MDSHDLAKDDDTAGRLPVQSLGMMDFGDLAFQCSQSLANARRSDAIAGHRRQASLFKFRNASRCVDAGDVHLLGEVSPNQICNELAGFADEVKAVLLALGGKHHHVRMRSYRVEE